MASDRRPSRGEDAGVTGDGNEARTHGSIGRRASWMVRSRRIENALPPRVGAARRSAPIGDLQNELRAARDAAPASTSASPDSVGDESPTSGYRWRSLHLLLIFQSCPVASRLSTDDQ
jgi:hypothetical protein